MRLSVVVVADVVGVGVVVVVVVASCMRRGVEDDAGCPPFSSLNNTT